MSETCDTRTTDLLSVEDARNRILDGIQALPGRERLALAEARGRVLARAALAPFDLPPFDNSAMDGYACRAEDLTASETSLRVIGRSMAGAPYTGAVRPGECVRIMTGAPLPPGADTVVMQEQVERKGDRARIHGSHRAGENIRRAGEEIARGSVVLGAGKRLDPASLALLASLGQVEVDVRRRPRVSFLSTGDELRPPGEPLGPGQIYDSNRYLLGALLHRTGIPATDLGILADERAAVREALREAATFSDVIISTGGVSVGEADYVRETLEELGELDLWRIRMKPGKPLAFGRLAGSLFFGLPGNPVSAAVTFALFVRPVLARLEGAAAPEPLLVPAHARVAFHNRSGRREYLRGILQRGPDGTLWVDRAGGQGSHMLSALAAANALIVLPEDSPGVEAGEAVDAIPLCSLD